jgi:glycosyltransferase involved in cell wall biosynthesis
MNKRSKICMNAMVANEAPVILRMLESCYQYIDYWVIQDNGSTDGTQDIIRNFFKEKSVPGFLYEIGWQYPGWNRDHTLQTCLQANHGCDWILRMDADEELVISEDFDWSLLDDHSVQSFNVTADSGGGIYYRTWLWNARLPWYFKHDKRHEVILLPGAGENDNQFQMVNLPKSFKHLLSNDGQTWAAPMKFLKDALELEADQVCSNKVLSDDYHLFYIGKSYNDCYNDPHLPFGDVHSKEYARRTIFYLEEYLKRIFPGYVNFQIPEEQNEMSYYSIALVGNAHRRLQNYETAIATYEYADSHCPDRNEHWIFLAETYEIMGEYEKMLEIMKMLIDPARKNPFPRWYFLIYNACYYDTGSYVKYLYEKAKNYLYPSNSISGNVENPVFFPGEL